jgi:hypothetical protein
MERATISCSGSLLTIVFNKGARLLPSLMDADISHEVALVLTAWGVGLT